MLTGVNNRRLALMAGRGMVLGKAGAEAVRLVDGFNIGRRGYATQLAGVFVARTSRDCGCKRRLTRGEPTLKGRQ